MSGSGVRLARNPRCAAFSNKDVRPDIYAGLLFARYQKVDRVQAIVTKSAEQVHRQ